MVNLEMAELLSRVALWEAVLYGVLLISGGVMGWAKKKSRASLVAGSVSGLCVLTTAWLGWEASEAARGTFFALAALALTLMAVFFNRYVSGGRKFLPAGLLTLVSAGSFLLYMAALLVA